jgi:enoyl-CoA hydratase/carnithine racemase
VDLKAVRYDVDDRVACITLNRPDRLNAWTGRMHTEYRWALEQAQADDSVRVVVVTGAGRGFCSGADSQALEGHAERGGYDPGTPSDLATPGYGVHPGLDHDFAFHLGLRTPVIAAINGPVAGVGLVLACYCDLRIAAAGTKLTTAHGRLNLPPEYGLSWILPRIVGLGHANDLLLSSRVVRAEEALAMGLVNRVLPAEDVLPAALTQAHELAYGVASRSLQETKRAIALDLFRDLGASIEEASRLLDEMMGEPDFAEGARALSEKRPPRF